MKTKPDVLVLHGGGGPASVARVVEALSTVANVSAPIHPGFMHTPQTVTTVAALADHYAAGLAEDTLVIGFSMGGWIGAELALRTRIRGLVLVNAVGIDVPSEPIADVASLTPLQLSALSMHDPVKFAIDPTKLAPEQLAAMQSNRAAMAVYGKAGMTDPTLAPRLVSVEVPVLVVWGESDRVSTPAYGRAFAAAFPRGRFELIAGAGHMPQLEQPSALLAAIKKFDDRLS